MALRRISSLCSRAYRILPYTLLLIVLIPALAAQAKEFEIREAHASFNETALSVDARFDLKLSEAVDEALHNGVSIQLKTTLDLYTQRPYMWDHHIAQWA